MTWAIVFIFAVVAFFLIQLATRKVEIDVKVAYAGSANGEPSVKRVPVGRNKTIFTEGENVVDLSHYDSFFISGNSLAKAGLDNGSFVYTLKPNTNEVDNLAGRFVIFQYDVARQAIEHPDVVVTDDSYKARKVVMVIDCGLDGDEFAHRMMPVIMSDDDISDKESAIKSIYKKYQWASDYYASTTDTLIVSMTYKGGDRKSYSFHSPNFLEGVVKYATV